MMLSKLLAGTTTTGGRRMFSRSDIMKGLDKSKVSRKAFIKKELTENPEFFKAFPHMQTMFNVDTKQRGNATREEEKLVINPRYHEEARVAFKDPSGKSSDSYFDTLLHHHNQYMPPTDKEEAIRENERNFVDAY